MTENSSRTTVHHINSSGWRLYKLKDLFRIKYGINMELVACEQEGGTINFVARTAENNGVVARVRPVEGKTPQPAGLITIAGGGSVLSTFLQREPFYSGRDLFVLDALEPMDNYAKLFITTLIQKEKYKFSYGRQANKSIPDIEIKLPQLDNGRPDYALMSSIIRSLPYADRI